MRSRMFHAGSPLMTTGDRSPFSTRAMRGPSSVFEQTMTAAETRPERRTIAGTRVLFMGILSSWNAGASSLIDGGRAPLVAGLRELAGQRAAKGMGLFEQGLVLLDRAGPAAGAVEHAHDRGAEIGEGVLERAHGVDGAGGAEGGV